MGKYIKYYNLASEATSDGTVVSPNLSYCDTMCVDIKSGDCGKADTEIVIKLEDGKLIYDIPS